MPISSISTSTSDVASKLSHRIRVPIHSVISYAELITENSDQNENPDLLQCMTGIVECCEGALRQVISFHGADLRSAVDFFVGRRENLISCGRKALGLAEEAGNFTDSGNLDLQKLSDSCRAFVDAAASISEDWVLGAAKDIPPEVQGSLQTTASHVRNRAAQPSPYRGLFLVVDDNENNREVLSRRLLRDGHEVMLAERGRQALRMLHRYNFDLVLLDMMMPEMDGAEVLSEIKRSPDLRELPVIMITAVDEIETVVRCIDLGADDYLLKPFNPALLRARVNSLLERKRLREQEKQQKEELRQALVDLESQRRRSEELILNILPPVVALELAEKGAVNPMYFEDVTIVFADIVSFTRWTEQLPADELVTILHEYFVEFDRIMEIYGVEKLKTIGDCYMFAGGLPIRTVSHPVDCVLAALQLSRSVQQRAESGPVNWEVRIGIHTGPVIAGVVGLHKFAFDIWGEAVNFSSRMQSSGHPGRVNLSPSTYTRVKDFFDCEKRPQVPIKDGREVDMYVVNGISTRLKAQNEIGPRKAFDLRYRTYFRKDLPAFPQFLLD
jgi:class 3 adenylate cyclase